MLTRTTHLEKIRRQLELIPVVALLGARQVGKTTLAREISRLADGPIHHFDLEDPSDLAQLQDPKLALAPLKGLIILDEIQRQPDIFPVLRVLVDRPNHEARFLILGSASPDLLRQSSESLAGRISFYELPGFDLAETGVETADELWMRGGFPRSYLAPDDEASDSWRRNFIRTYLERDLPQLGIRVPAETLRRFWTMVAHSHGQFLNLSRLAAAMGVSSTAVNNYIDILCDTYMVRRLPPYLPNIGKRMVKSPKVYLRDSGLLHTLLSLSNTHEVLGHPIVGASWEGFALETVIRHRQADERECFFWATHNGAELDLVIDKGGRRVGFEFKRTSSPRTTKSMHVALESLELDELVVVYPGDKEFPMADHVVAMPLGNIVQDFLQD
jgi:predicted AAA+ superfamily ATPase